MTLQRAFRLSPAGVISIAGALLALLAWIAPAPAAAACPTSGLGSGSLPDCRVYEQVSPLDKNAYEAGALRPETPSLSISSPDGSKILYSTSGAMGETEVGFQPYTLSSRGSDGWLARNPFPRPQDPGGIAFAHNIRSMITTPDLSSIFFWSGDSWLPQVPADSPAAYLMREDQPLRWVTEPRDEDVYESSESGIGHPASFRIRSAGSSPDLDRVYFGYLGTLLPGDEPRVPYAEELKALGLYEYEAGQLRNAGTLPDGTLDPMGAAAAGSVNEELTPTDLTSRETFNNQVSADGDTLWFVSPDPTPDPPKVEAGVRTGRVPQLYVRVNGTSELVSRSELTGLPAATGVYPVPHVREEFPGESFAYVFGAEDGSRAFFQSHDRLTADAPEDETQKTYVYEVATDDLVYLAALNGAHILEGSQDGSRLLLLNADRTRLELWEEGSGLTLVGEVAASSFYGAYIPTTRATAGGSVFAFALAGEVAGFPNPSLLPQAYRYEVASGELTCLSCPPGGAAPNSDAVMSRVNNSTATDPDANLSGIRAMTADGQSVFFDTSEALVATDTNGRRDAYRWSEEDGPRLISTGRSGFGSFMLDISVDGSSAFFATKEGISPLDSDGSYDVYVARVGGGFPSTGLPPCQGDECQGPTAGPPALDEPGSKSFRGRGSGSNGSRLAARLNGRGGKLWLRVNVPTSGRVVVSGPRVQPLRRRIAKAGSYLLRPKLKPVARKALNQRGQLEVRLKVRFRTRGGQITARTLTTEVSR